jgi:thiamine-monophosphate kinase
VAPGARRPDNAGVGEFDLLKRVRERLPPPDGRVTLGPGDDAAISRPTGATATSVDALIDGVHFRRETSPLRSIGHKALAAALSDLAAMGAEAGEAYIVLGVPPDLGEDECMELLEGSFAVAEGCGAVLAGGDVTRSPVLSLAVTVVGHAAEPGDFVSRDGAQPGDALVVTGDLGSAAAGLLLLERPELAREIPDPAAAAAKARQLEPWPRLAEGRALAAAGATAMIDVSDGFGADAGHLAGGVGLRVDASLLPVAEEARPVAAAAERDPADLAVSGGEDYELVACLPPQAVADAVEAVEALGGRLTPVGEAVDGRGVEIRLPDGGRLAPGGFDQLG